MEEDRHKETLKRELAAAREEIDRLRTENTRLKTLLNSFALKPASALAVPAAKRNGDRTASRQPETSPKTPVPSPATEDGSLSQTEKIALYRSLFRGRDDVFARRWESNKGRSGYSPACAHEWHPFLCRKPCAKCNNSKYIPISDKVIHDHILGKHTIGIYPMLQDETCWFLAADFDKEGWREDACAFLDACRELEVTAALERSRSGRGGHVWIFFEESVPA